LQLKQNQLDDTFFEIKQNKPCEFFNSHIFPVTRKAYLLKHKE